MAKRMRTTAQIEAERAADRAKLLAGMTERELVAYFGQLCDELADTRMDYRLTDRHVAIMAAIRAELANRTAAA